MDGDGVDEALVNAAMRVIDANHYLTLGTVDPDGTPRLSPVRYGRIGYRRLCWGSLPSARHSLTIAASPEIRIVIFDSHAEDFQGEGVFLAATAAQVAPDDLEQVCSLLGSPDPDIFRGDSAFRLHQARITACDVHIGRLHRVLGRGVDVRQAVNLPDE